VSANIKK